MGQPRDRERVALLVAAAVGTAVGVVAAEAGAVAAGATVARRFGAGPAGSIRQAVATVGSVSAANVPPLSRLHLRSVPSAATTRPTARDGAPCSGATP